MTRNRDANHTSSNIAPTKVKIFVIFIICIICITFSLKVQAAEEIKITTTPTPDNPTTIIRPVPVTAPRTVVPQPTTPTRLVYRVNGRCVDSPVCCCAKNDIIVTHSDTPGKVNIAATLPGGPSCGGKVNVSSLFDIISPTISAFAEPGTPLQIRAVLSQDHKQISFSNNIQSCASVGDLVSQSGTPHAFNTFSSTPLDLTHTITDSGFENSLLNPIDTGFVNPRTVSAPFITPVNEVAAFGPNEASFASFGRGFDSDGNIPPNFRSNSFPSQLQQQNQPQIQSLQFQPQGQPPQGQPPQFQPQVQPPQFQPQGQPPQFQPQVQPQIQPFNGGNVVNGSNFGEFNPNIIQNQNVVGIATIDSATGNLAATTTTTTTTQPAFTSGIDNSNLVDPNIAVRTQNAQAQGFGGFGQPNANFNPNISPSVPNVNTLNALNTFNNANNFNFGPGPQFAPGQPQFNPGQPQFNPGQPQFAPFRAQQHRGVIFG
jgi:hypothetical protein